MKKYIPLLSIILLFFTYVVNAQVTTLKIPDLTVKKNTEFELPVLSAPIKNVGSTTIKLKYDPEVLEFKGVASSPFKESDIVSNAKDGILTLGAFSVNPVDIVDNLFKLKFLLKKGSTDVVFTYAQITDPSGNTDYPVSTEGGHVGLATVKLELGKVKGAGGDTVLVPLQGENLSGVGSMQIFVKYDTEAVTYLGVEEKFDFTVTSTEDNGLVALTWFSTDNKPVDIAKKLLANIKFKIKGGTSELEFKNVEIADLDGTKFIIELKNGEVGAEKIMLSLPTIENVGTGDMISVPLRVQKVKDMASMQIFVKYDKEALSFKGIDKEFDFVASTEDNGLIGLTWYSTTSPASFDDKVIAKLKFEVKSGLTNLEFTNLEFVNKDGNNMPYTFTNGKVDIIPATIALGTAEGAIGDTVSIPLTAKKLKGIAAMQFFVEYDADKVEYVEFDKKFDFQVSGTKGKVGFGWFSTTTPANFDESLLGNIKFVIKSGATDLKFVNTEITNTSGELVHPVFTSGKIGVEASLLSLGSATGVIGDTVVIPLTGKKIKNIASMQFAVNYDPANVEFVSVDKKFDFTVGATAGKVNFGWFSTTPTNIGDEVLANIKFVIKAGASALNFANVEFASIDGKNILVELQNGKISIETATLSMDKVRSILGDTVTVPLRLKKARNLAAMQFVVNYNPAKVTFVGIDKKYEFQINDKTEGQIIFGWFSTTAKNVEDVVLANLKFQAKVVAPSDLTFGKVELTDINGNLIPVTTVKGEIRVIVVTALPVIEKAEGGTLDQPWSSVNSFSEDTGSSVVIVEDSTSSAWGSHIAVLDDEEGQGMALVDKVFPPDYTVSADIWINGEYDATQPIYRGLTVKASADGKNFYRFVYRNSRSSFGQLRLQAGSGNMMTGVYCEPDKDFEKLSTGWHNFKVSIVGNKMYAYIDGKLLPKTPVKLIANPDFISDGAPGIYKWSAGTGKVKFDNFMVENFINPEYKIAKIQAPVSATDDKSAIAGKTVITNGIITGAKVVNDTTLHFTVQDLTGPWNGVMAYNANIPMKVSIGDSVTFQGTVAEFEGRTQLTNIHGLTVRKSDVKLPEAPQISFAEASKEEYEGVLVYLYGSECIAAADQFGQAKFKDAANEMLSDDLLFDFNFEASKTYDIKGVIDYSAGAFKVLPVSNELITGIGGGNSSLPTDFALEQNYPNPFNPATKIKYSLKVDSKVTLDVYNIIGQKVKTLVDAVEQSAGIKEVDFNASDISSGVYIYRLEAIGNDGSKFVKVKKMTLLK